MKKRIFALLLALTMVTALFAGCGSNEEESGGDAKNEQTVNSETEIESETEFETEADTEEQKTTPDANADEKKSIKLGKISETIYENETFKIGWTLLEGWKFLSEEEILAINNLTTDMLDDEESLAEILENTQVLTDMQAVNSNTGASINIQIQNIGVAGALYSESFILEGTLESLKTALQTMGATDVVAEVVTVEVMGEEHAAIDLVCKIQGIDFYEKIVCVKDGQYMICITSGSYAEDTTDDILSNLYRMEE